MSQSVVQAGGDTVTQRMQKVIFPVLAVIVAFMLLVPIYVLLKVSLSTLAQATALIRATSLKADAG